ncbi:MAG: adenine phosphoribosyltransferase [Cyclobacteriaceae bacterium]|jgi:adenine phosphoribosyltransferase
MPDLLSDLLLMIRDVPDFPKKGIVFKDITPILGNPVLSKRVSDAFYESWKDQKLDGVAGIESRGFIFGMQLAQQLGLPFIPIRKKGKLPYHTISQKYNLEYGTSELEVHTDAIKEGQRILIHDDLLATGGTANAAASLISKLKGEVAGYSFLVELSFLAGAADLKNKNIHSLVKY